MRKAWFDKAISFSCTSCGKCCKSNGATRVFVNSKEIKSIATAVNMSVDAVNKEYITTVLGNDGTELNSLKKHSSKNQCVFLDGNKCSIYSARPTQCRTYPYWPHIMIGEAEWRAESVSCEGIKLDTDALVVSAVDSEEVALNMLVHQVHNRGRGEDWTYEDAVELIVETASVEPHLIPEYLDEFYQSNNSRIVHESLFLRVVDSQCTQPGPNLEESDSDNSSSNSNSAAADQGEEAVYSRRMEFIRSPQLAQTEMHLLNGPQLWAAHDDQRLGLVVPEAQLDYRRLHMPVHRVLGSACVQFLQLQHRLQNGHTAAASVAVIGAGCCALPSYLLAQGNLPSVVVHAVEPSSEVLQTAETYFGAQFSTEQHALESKEGGVVPHCMGGSEFLLQQPQRCFDAIIIDAFADEQGDTAATERTPRAPPASLLDWVSLHALLTPKTGATKAAGVLLINVYGTAQWQEEVQQRLDSSGLFCRPCVLPASDLLESGLRTSPGVQCSNIVLATAPVEAAEGFSEFRQVLLSHEVT